MQDFGHTQMDMMRQAVSSRSEGRVLTAFDGVGWLHYILQPHFQCHSLPPVFGDLPHNRQEYSKIFVLVCRDQAPADIQKFGFSKQGL